MPTNDPTRCTYEEFKEVARELGLSWRAAPNAWRWAVLGIKSSNFNPLEVTTTTLTKKQLAAAKKRGHEAFPRMNDEMWDVFAAVVDKLTEGS